ncbi:HlyD family type I secretion periplasmic adaptor subunit [Beijerinckia indica]|uniref:Membrane fusion protein (MFP) family protein n=1 Tax=Beijerinckia indica subsp. indica (strain ATCC 9039 / DSM 1715 / NCIMB 8712) TaxID=395963 RepID=B2IL49_BEII9|nr:HlyD family type I secretion periplasmic adaptor subunit [Beijerinckia indica]ACB97249.1 type I secretion membrane fusion protein, HlyD family [Beijerinckia indica subsp. indica ATCC 9039]
MKRVLALLGRRGEPRAFRPDQEFLPAALAILETPPSPIGIALLCTICLLAVTALAWASFSRIDVIAVAQGKIQPAGRVKPIQPVETGKVIAIQAANGQHVKQGEILVALDPEDAQAETVALTMSLASFKAEILRRKAALEATKEHLLRPLPLVRWEEEIPRPIQEREERVLRGDLALFAAQIEGLVAQRRQKEAEQERLTKTIAAQEALLATLDQRVAMREALVQHSAGTRANLLDAIESRQYQDVILKTQQGQKAENVASLAVLIQDIAKSYETFTAENSQKLADAERQADENAQRLVKARVKLGHMLLTSPIDGTVQALSVTTPGQVIASGEEIMRIVPDAPVLEIECYLQNKDSGFVRPGQEAVVKVESFPFTRFGTLGADVVRVAQDAIPEPDAQLIEGNPAKSNRSTVFAGAQRVQNLVFPVTLRLAASTMIIEGTPVPLSPGMAVSVEIKTGSRRVIDYLFSPLVEVVTSAMRER